MTRVVLAVVFVLLLTGCGGADRAEEGGSSTVPTRECDPLAGGSLTKKLNPAVKEGETTFLTDVEIEIEECVERVIFSLKEREPGSNSWEASYQPPEVAKIEDGSGDLLAIAGSDFIVVRMFPAMTAEIEGEDVKPTYKGPRNIPAPAEARFIREVALTGDFEALLTWAIGLDNKHPFTATVADGKLVVEIGL